MGGIGGANLLAVLSISHQRSRRLNILPHFRWKCVSVATPPLQSRHPLQQVDDVTVNQLLCGADQQVLLQSVKMLETEPMWTVVSLQTRLNLVQKNVSICVLTNMTS